MYGIYPSDEVDRSLLKIRPVMSLKSTVTYIKEIGPGDEVSYGGTYKADRTVKVATIPAGYGDGYPRHLSNCGEVLIRGMKAPIRGRVCMDQLMVDVSEVKNVKMGDIVTIIGEDGDDVISSDDIAKMLGTINYEVVSCIGKRVPQIYIYD